MKNEIFTIVQFKKFGNLKKKGNEKMNKGTFFKNFFLFILFFGTFFFYFCCGYFFVF